MRNVPRDANFFEENFDHELLPHSLCLDQDSMVRWLNALSFLPNDPSKMLMWIDGPLRDFFSFESVVCVHGELFAGQIVATDVLTIGVSEEQLAYLSASFELSQRGTLAQWFTNRLPFLIDPEFPPSCVTPFELDEIRRFNMRNVVAHGVLNAKANAGTYFSFAGVESPLSDWHLQAMRLIAPVLNDLFLAKIANGNPATEMLSSLTPRQRLIVRYLITGLDNKSIAKNMNIAEKTVRNQLSEIYSILKIHKRGQLQALSRL